MNPARALMMLWAVLLLALPARPAYADKAAAEALFQEGKKLADDKKWAEACPKFAGSFKLDEQLGTLLNLADCLEQEGKLASSWARFNRAIEWAKRTNDSRLEWIKGRQQAVEPRLARLKVVVGEPVAGLSVWRDGSPVVKESFGVALPVDPGERVVQVRRGLQVLIEQKVSLEEGEQKAVQLDLAAIAAANPVPLPPPPPPPPPRKPPPRKPYDPTQRNVGFVLGGVGAAGVLVAGGFGVAALIKKDEADQPDACINRLCSPQGLQAAEDGALFAEVGQWVGVGGLAMLAIGTTVLLTAPSEEEPPVAGAQLTPLLGPGVFGLGLNGSF